MTEKEASEYNRLEGELNSISEKIRETGNRLQELKNSDEYKKCAKTAKGTGHKSSCFMGSICLCRTNKRRRQRAGARMEKKLPTAYVRNVRCFFTAFF